MAVSERGRQVLRAIVQDYVDSREPVGSKSIVERHSFGVSAATIRNDMALLEEEELITAPHTSSGRVPTDKGYRLFVDELAEVKPLSAAQRHAIETFLGQSSDLDEVLGRTVRLLSQLTHQVALVQYPTLSAARIRHIEFVQIADAKVLSVVITDTGRVEQRVVDLPSPVDVAGLADLRAKFNSVASSGLVVDAAAVLRSFVQDAPAPERPVVSALADSIIEQLATGSQDRLIMAGAANLVRTEGDFGGSILPVLEAVEEQVVLLRLFGEMELDRKGISARIGRENESFGLGETSVLSSGYNTGGGTLARVGVLGPTRMDYSGNMAAVRAVARYLTRLFGDDRA